MRDCSAAPLRPKLDSFATFRDEDEETFTTRRKHGHVTPPIPGRVVFTYFKREQPPS
jgi:hypothetical protein